MDNVVAVLPIGPFNSYYSYKSDAEVIIGSIVQIPFGRQTIIGMVVDGDVSTNIPLKNISNIFQYKLLTKQIDFIRWMSKYTFIPQGIVLKMMLSEKTVFTIKKNIETIIKTISCSVIELNKEQQNAYQAAITDISKPFLLHGITGSGKTEVYLKLAQQIISLQKQILILLPEIALTSQIIFRIKKYFGISPLIWHSSVTHKQKREIWETIYAGIPCIVIGTRSALFLPFANLGLIVVDEEHDASYKQEESSCYNARDMAVVLAHIYKIKMILSSATPSLESYLNVKQNKYGYCYLNKKYSNTKISKIFMIDMKQNKFEGHLSPVLIEKIKSNLDKKEQSLIYINRRGYSPITLCKTCGEKIACPNCSSWLTYHKSNNKLICHYCGHKINYINKCYACGEDGGCIQFGPGVEKIYDELVARFPNGNVLIASSDTMNSTKKIKNILEQINTNKVDIIVSTQILSKGYHFPNITLVGIIDGDSGLYNADLRASEKLFQTIQQVSGRAGREEKKGAIFIQSFQPNNPLFKTIINNDIQLFFSEEMDVRKQTDMPPFSKLISIIISGNNKQLTEKYAHQITAACPQNIKFFGPSPAPLFLLKGRSRWRILLKLPKNAAPYENINNWLKMIKIPKNIKIQLDVDPISFL